MLGEICAEIRNYFTPENDRHIGDWVIRNGAISPALDIPTGYFRIIGSRLNNGVHTTEDALKDEEFHGSIWVMSPPESFLSLVEDIKAWQTKYGSVDSVNMSPYQSESFNNYSYSKGSGDSTSYVPNWQNMFSNRLNLYRRIREL